MSRVLLIAPGVQLTLPSVLAGFTPIQQLDGGPTIEQPNLVARSLTTHSMIDGTQVTEQWTMEAWSLHLVDPESKVPLHIETIDAEYADQRAIDAFRLRPLLQDTSPDTAGRRIVVAESGDSILGVYDDGRYLIRLTGKADAAGAKRAEAPRVW